MMKEPLLNTILSGRRPVVPYTQPIIGLKTGAIEAREILTRFEDENGQMRTVGSLLEDRSLPSDSRMKLDMLCVRSVFEALAISPITDHLIFINLSPLTLECPDFWRQIRPWLWDLTIPPHRLVLEITETYAMHDLDCLEAYARQLRNLDLRIAVDDLGSGAASLTHMARLAPDFIKVDRSLVHQAHHRPYQAALLNALAKFAEQMRVGCIAEGIETAEELQTILDADIPWGQGFLFGEPEPLRLLPATSQIFG